MRQRIVTSAQGDSYYITIDGDVMDAIAYDYYGKHEKNTEALLDANPQIIDLGITLPAGVAIRLPAISRQETPAPFRQLWD